MSDSPIVCRHGNRKNCEDCLLYMLEDIRVMLKNPDVALLVANGTYVGLNRQIDFAIKNLNAHHADVEEDVPPPHFSEVFAPERGPPSPATQFRPETVFGSAWAPRPPPLDTPKKKQIANDDYNLEKVSPNSPGSHGGYPKVRSKWTASDVEVLKAAFKAYPRQWESMRRNFPQLQKYTGMQLKDKYKTL